MPWTDDGLDHDESDAPITRRERAETRGARHAAAGDPDARRAVLGGLAGALGLGAGALGLQTLRPEGDTLAQMAGGSPAGRGADARAGSSSTRGSRRAEDRASVRRVGQQGRSQASAARADGVTGSTSTGSTSTGSSTGTPSASPSSSSSGGSRRRSGSSSSSSTKARPSSRKVGTMPSEGAAARDRDDSYASAQATGSGSSSRTAAGAAAMPALPAGRQYSGFAAAAAAADPVAPAVFATDSPEAHLLRRATFGARPEDVALLAAKGIDDWLSMQLSPASISDGVADQAWNAFPLAGGTARRVRSSIKQYGWEAMVETSQATIGRQVFSQRQLFEQMVDVMAGHLHITIPSGEVWETGPDYIVQVVRKHAFGRFEDMLIDAMKHPAMLAYLNNNVSDKENVNENLGRELLELHTVGVGSGYTEEDVRNSAYILTGRTIANDPTRFVYDEGMHWTGAVKVLGFSHANTSAAGGMELGDAYLSYLAKHRSTALTIARKLAVRFVADQPSDDLVERLADVYLEHDTDLREVLRAVFQSSDFWSSVGMKVRRPLEDLVGTARVLDVAPGGQLRKGLEELHWLLTLAGHAPYGWAAPNGYPDVAAAWLGAGGMIARWNVHRRLARDWHKAGLTITQPAELVDTTSAKVGPWMDSLAERMVGQKLDESHRSALLTYAGLSSGAAAADSLTEAPHLASLLLDSPYFQLR